jgi:hypothetical protein
LYPSLLVAYVGLLAEASGNSMEQSVPNFHTEPASKRKKARPFKETGPFLVVNDLGPEGQAPVFL